MVPESVLKAMMEIGALSFVIPFAFVLLWKMRFRKSIIPSLVGVFIFITFGIILKSVPNMLFTAIDSPISRFLKENIWAYVLYAALIAGIFEETGRYFAFKVFLSKHDYRESSVAYGLGHGGVECMAVLGFTMIQNFTYAQLINAGQMEEVYSSFTDEGAVKVFKDLEQAILNLTVSDCVWAGIERLSAIILQVALSVLVFQAVHVTGKKRMLAVAIALHTVIDIFAGLYQQGKLSLVITEVIIIIYALAVAVFAYRVYQTLPHEEEEVKHEPGKNWAYAAMKYNDKNGNSAIEDIKSTTDNRIEANMDDNSKNGGSRQDNGSGGN